MGHQKFYPKSVYNDNHKRTRTEHQKDISTYLPPEIITEILLRLPVQTILRCKCVCKSWRHLFETHNFARSYHSNSLVPVGIALAVESDNSLYIEGSVDGLLLLKKYEGLGRKYCALYVYNPITREYIDLLQSHSLSFNAIKLVYGFGGSKITGQYKVVGVAAFQTPKVYTIGTGSWRSIAPRDKVRCPVRSNKVLRGPFVNGNLHWITHDIYGRLWISCFDLETEIFKDFSPPFKIDRIEIIRRPYPRQDPPVGVATIGDTLCVCHYTLRHVEIWLMKEYGDENSWTRQFIIKRNIEIWHDSRICPIKFSKDGVILFSHDTSLYYYSSEDGENTKVNLSNCNFQGFASQVHSFTPSFLSPDCFKMENVLSLGFFKVNLYLDW